MSNLNNINILVTAGPTWVPIDKVRVITNVFGGTLGAIIASEAAKTGANVTLLFGPGKAQIPQNIKNLKIIRYKFYDDLLRLVKGELKNGQYDIMIHSSAVADYTPILAKEGKIKSGKKELIIRLKPTQKIVDLIKKISPKIFLVKFKLEVGLPKKKLVDVAYNSMVASKADLIVANEYSTVKKDHVAYIINNNRITLKVSGKNNIAKKLIDTICKSMN